MNAKWWSGLFGLVMIACAGLFVVAPFVGWWLPEPQSDHAEKIDFLFYLILAITGFFFILTEALLVGFMFRYGGGTLGEARKPSLWWNVVKPLAGVLNTSGKIEMAWTIVPAVILLYLAFAQIDTWAQVKYRSRLDANVWGKEQPMPVQVDLSARQFEWRFRYPSPATWAAWQKNPEKAKSWVKNLEFDDVYVPNELHMIKNRHVVIQLSTKDVIHSFNMPHMRVKQDALPGKTIPVWFKPVASNIGHVMLNGKIVAWQDGGGREPETGDAKDPKLVWEIACAELCGWGHYRMVGRGYVHETEEDFAAWLRSAATRQADFGPTEQKK